MGWITVKPEQEPEQTKGTGGNGDSLGLALRFRVWGVFTHLTVENAPQREGHNGMTHFGGSSNSSIKYRNSGNERLASSSILADGLLR